MDVDRQLEFINQAKECVKVYQSLLVNVDLLAVGAMKGASSQEKKRLIRVHEDAQDCIGWMYKFQKETLVKANKDLSEIMSLVASLG
jgi:hypothetical protein